MSYELASHPEWTCDELRNYLGDKAREYLGPGDRDRLVALDVAPYVPQSLNEAMSALDGEQVGPMVQVAGYLRSAHDAGTGEAFRFVVPHLIKFRDLEKLAKQLDRALQNRLTVLRRRENGGADVPVVRLH